MVQELSEIMPWGCQLYKNVVIFILQCTVLEIEPTFYFLRWSLLSALKCLFIWFDGDEDIVENDGVLKYVCPLWNSTKQLIFPFLTSFSELCENVDWNGSQRQKPQTKIGQISSKQHALM